MKALDLVKKPDQTEQQPKIYVAETFEFGNKIDQKNAVSMFGADTVKSLLNARGIGIVFTRDTHGRNWKVLKNTQGELFAERDFMMEGDSIVFEQGRSAVAGTVVDITESSMIIEGETFELSEIDVEEGAGKWLSIAAMLGLFGLGLGQVLDTAAPERTPLGNAMSYAASTGDKYAAKELRMLRNYIEAGDWDKIKQLNDTYLNVKYDDSYLAANPQVDFGQNWANNTLTGRAVKNAVDENDGANVINKTFSAMADSISTSTVRRAGIMSMQGRYAEAEGAMRQHLAKMSPDIAKKVQDSIRNIKPVTINGKVADTSALEKSKQHTDWLDKTFIPWVLKITSVNEEHSEITEAKYQGREVKLGKPMRGDVKKYKVYVKDPKTGNIKKVNFGDKNMEIKRDNPDNRKNFRARHGCGTPRASDKTKAAYWSCRLWSSTPVSKIVKED